MNIDEYKKQLEILTEKYPKKYRGTKYIKNWDYHWEEKKKIIDLADLSGVKTALDIGTGMGILAYQLQQRGIDVEATDIDVDTTGYLFKEATNLINLPVHYLKIFPKTPIDLPKKYDIVFSTRTEFDRQDGFCWEWFLNDCFEYTNQIVIKTNRGNKTNPFPQRLHRYSIKDETWIICLKKQEFFSED